MTPGDVCVLGRSSQELLPGRQSFNTIQQTGSETGQIFRRPSRPELGPLVDQLFLDAPFQMQFEFQALLRQGESIGEFEVCQSAESRLPKLSYSLNR